MRELNDQELYHALAYAKGIDEEGGEKILEQFQLEQTALAQGIFGIFPTVIAEETYLFMGLCFSVLCIYQKVFGPCPPKITWMLTGWKSRRFSPGR